MKKALVAVLLTVIVLAISILPAFAATNASEVTNYVEISPIIYILQENGFTVNTEKAFNNATKGIIEFSGNITVGEIYKSNLTIATFVKNFSKTKYTFAKWESDLEITFYAGNTILDFNEPDMVIWDVDPTAQIGIQFNNTNYYDTHTISLLTVFQSTAQAEITDDLTQSNWPKSADFEIGYMYVPPVKNTDYKTGNLFATARISVEVTYIETGNSPYTITYYTDDSDLIYGGISFARIDTLVQERVGTRWDYGCAATQATVTISYISQQDSFEWFSQSIFRSGSSTVWTMQVRPFPVLYNVVFTATPNTGGNFAKYVITEEDNPNLTTPLWVRSMTLTFNCNYIGGPGEQGQGEAETGPINFSLVTNSEAYNLGYNTGYEQGANDGTTQGYENGLIKGEKNGYNKGYNDGANAGNTWYQLFFAVVDAPVHIFSSLLNFEIFGVNMRNFALALLTLGIFIIIIKKVIL